MTKKEIYKVLKALKDFCKSNKDCIKCEFYRTCCYKPDYAIWTAADIKLLTDILKAFIDGKEDQSDGKS